MALDKFCLKRGVGWGWRRGPQWGPWADPEDSREEPESRVPHGYISTINYHFMFKLHFKANYHLFGGVGREERRGRGGGERTTMIPVLKHFVKALTSKAALGMVVCGVCVAHSGVQLSEQPPLWVPGRPTSSFQRAAEMLWRP